MRISDWSSDVCSSDLADVVGAYRTIRKELAAYGGGLETKAEVVGLNKADALDKDSRREKQAALEQASGAKVICLSGRSEEHTSELQSLMRISYAVFCLQKKIKTKPKHKTRDTRKQKD